MREQTQRGFFARKAVAGSKTAALLLVILTLLAACGGEAAPTTAPSAATPTTGAASADPTATTGSTSAGGTTTISYMIWHDDIANDKNLNNLVNLYNSSQSEVKVELIGAGWNDYVSKLQAMVAADTPPDVLAIQNEGDFVSKGFVMPLEDLIAQHNIDLKNFIPGAIEPAYDGKIYGFRHDTAFWLLYYNKDLFDAAGVPYPPATGYKTVDEFMQVACQLSKPADLQWGMHNLHWLNGIYAKQQGLPYMELDGPNGAPQYHMDDPKTMEYYQKVADFINVQNCQPNADQNNSLGGANPFLSGRTAMAFDGNWGFGNVRENAQFNWAVAPIPGVAQPNVGMKTGIVATSKNKEAAWKFLKWLTYDPEATRFRAEVGMGQPAITDEEANNIFSGGENAPEGLDDVLTALARPDSSFTMPGVPGQSEADGIVNPVNDEVMQGLAKAADVMPEAVQKANEVLVREWEKVQSQ